MNAEEVLTQLRTVGTEQMRRTSRRHGVQGDVYGVSYVEFGKLKKKLKVAGPLAEELWASGNHDARVLATMIGDPAAISEQTVDSWSRDLDSYPITDAFGGFVARTPFAMKKMKQWMKADHERLESVAWRLLSELARDSTLPDSFFDEHLKTIERQIHTAKNRVRHSMNGAVIAIGGTI